MTQPVPGVPRIPPKDGSRRSRALTGTSSPCTCLRLFFHRFCIVVIVRVTFYKFV